METEPKKKGRGRPPKAIKDGEVTPKKSKATKRGRPKTDEGEYFCLVLLQVPKCFGLVQIFCARPKIYLHIVAVTNFLCQTKR